MCELKASVFRLDTRNIDAAFTDGVLTIKVTKRADAKPVRVEIH